MNLARFANMSLRGLLLSACVCVCVGQSFLLKRCTTSAGSSTCTTIEPNAIVSGALGAQFSVEVFGLDLAALSSTSGTVTLPTATDAFTVLRGGEDTGSLFPFTGGAATISSSALVFSLQLIADAVGDLRFGLRRGLAYTLTTSGAAASVTRMPILRQAGGAAVGQTPSLVLGVTPTLTVGYDEKCSSFAAPVGTGTNLRPPDPSLPYTNIRAFLCVSGLLGVREPSTIQAGASVTVARLKSPKDVADASGEWLSWSTRRPASVDTSGRIAMMLEPAAAYGIMPGEYTFTITAGTVVMPGVAVVTGPPASFSVVQHFYVNYTIEVLQLPHVADAPSARSFLERDRLPVNSSAVTLDWVSGIRSSLRTRPMRESSPCAVRVAFPALPFAVGRLEQIASTTVLFASPAPFQPVDTLTQQGEWSRGSPWASVTFTFLLPPRSDPALQPILCPGETDVIVSAILKHILCWNVDRVLAWQPIAALYRATTTSTFTYLTPAQVVSSSLTDVRLALFVPSLGTPASPPRFQSFFVEGPSRVAITSTVDVPSPTALGPASPLLQDVLGANINAPWGGDTNTRYLLYTLAFAKNMPPGVYRITVPQEVLTDDRQAKNSAADLQFTIGESTTVSSLYLDTHLQAFVLRVELPADPCSFANSERIKVGVRFRVDAATCDAVSKFAASVAPPKPGSFTFTQPRPGYTAAGTCSAQVPPSTPWYRTELQQCDIATVSAASNSYALPVLATDSSLIPVADCSATPRQIRLFGFVSGLKSGQSSVAIVRIPEVVLDWMLNRIKVESVDPTITASSMGSSSQIQYGMANAAGNDLASQPSSEFLAKLLQRFAPLRLWRTVQPADAATSVSPVPAWFTQGRSLASSSLRPLSETSSGSATAFVSHAAGAARSAVQVRVSSTCSSVTSLTILQQRCNSAPVSSIVATPRTQMFRGSQWLHEVVLDTRGSFDPDGDDISAQYVLLSKPARSQVQVPSNTQRLGDPIKVSDTLAVSNHSATRFYPDVGGVYVLGFNVSDGCSTASSQVEVRLDCPVTAKPTATIATLTPTAAGGTDKSEAWVYRLQAPLTGYFADGSTVFRYHWRIRSVAAWPRSIQAAISRGGWQAPAFTGQLTQDLLPVDLDPMPTCIDASGVRTCTYACVVRRTGNQTSPPTFATSSAELSRIQRVVDARPVGDTTSSYAGTGYERTLDKASTTQVGSPTVMEQRGSASIASRWEQSVELAGSRRIDDFTIEYRVDKPWFATVRVQKTSLACQVPVEVELAVTDECRKDEVSATTWIEMPACGAAPVARVGSSLALLRHSVNGGFPSVTLDASGTDDDDTPVDKLAFTWTPVSGDARVLSPKSGSGRLFTHPEIKQAGNYTWSLRVSDDCPRDVFSESVVTVLAQCRPILATVLPGTGTTRASSAAFNAIVGSSANLLIQWSWATADVAGLGSFSPSSITYERATASPLIITTLRTEDTSAARPALEVTVRVVSKPLESTVTVARTVPLQPSTSPATLHDFVPDAPGTYVIEFTVRLALDDSKACTSLTGTSPAVRVITIEVTASCRPRTLAMGIVVEYSATSPANAESDDTPPGSGSCRVPSLYETITGFVLPVELDVVRTLQDSLVLPYSGSVSRWPNIEAWAYTSSNTQSSPALAPTLTEATLGSAIAAAPTSATSQGVTRYRWTVSSNLATPTGRNFTLTATLQEFKCPRLVTSATVSFVCNRVLLGTKVDLAISSAVVRGFPQPTGQTNVVAPLSLESPRRPMCNAAADVFPILFDGFIGSFPDVIPTVVGEYVLPVYETTSRSILIQQPYIASSTQLLASRSALSPTATEPNRIIVDSPTGPVGQVSQANPILGSKLHTGVPVNVSWVTSDGCLSGMRGRAVLLPTCARFSVTLQAASCVPAASASTAATPGTSSNALSRWNYETQTFQSVELLVNAEYTEPAYFGASPSKRFQDGRPLSVWLQPSVSPLRQLIAAALPLRGPITSTRLGGHVTDDWTGKVDTSASTATSGRTFTVNMAAASVLNSAPPGVAPVNDVRIVPVLPSALQDAGAVDVNGDGVLEFVFSFRLRDSPGASGVLDFDTCPNGRISEAPREFFQPLGQRSDVDRSSPLASTWHAVPVRLRLFAVDPVASNIDAASLPEPIAESDTTTCFNGVVAQRLQFPLSGINVRKRLSFLLLLQHDSSLYPLTLASPFYTGLPASQTPAQRLDSALSRVSFRHSDANPKASALTEALGTDDKSSIISHFTRYNSEGIPNNPLSLSTPAGTPPLPAAAKAWFFPPARGTFQLAASVGDGCAVQTSASLQVIASCRPIRVEAYIVYGTTNLGTSATISSRRGKVPQVSMRAYGFYSDTAADLASTATSPKKNIDPTAVGVRYEWSALQPNGQQVPSIAFSGTNAIRFFRPPLLGTATARYSFSANISDGCSFSTSCAEFFIEFSCEDFTFELTAGWAATEPPRVSLARAVAGYVWPATTPLTLRAFYPAVSGGAGAGPLDLNTISVASADWKVPDKETEFFESTFTPADSTTPIPLVWQSRVRKPPTPLEALWYASNGSQIVAVAYRQLPIASNGDAAYQLEPLAPGFHDVTLRVNDGCVEKRALYRIQATCPQQLQWTVPITRSAVHTSGLNTQSDRITVPDVLRDTAELPSVSVLTAAWTNLNTNPDEILLVQKTQAALLPRWAVEVVASPPGASTVKPQCTIAGVSNPSSCPTMSTSLGQKITDFYFTPTDAGRYVLRVTVSDGCKSLTELVTIDVVEPKCVPTVRDYSGRLTYDINPFDSVSFRTSELNEPRFMCANYPVVQLSSSGGRSPGEPLTLLADATGWQSATISLAASYMILDPFTSAGMNPSMFAYVSFAVVGAPTTSRYWTLRTPANAALPSGPSLSVATKQSTLAAASRLSATFTPDVTGTYTIAVTIAASTPDFEPDWSPTKDAQRPRGTMCTAFCGVGIGFIKVHADCGGIDSCLSFFKPAQTRPACAVGAYDVGTLTKVLTAGTGVSLDTFTLDGSGLITSTPGEAAVDTGTLAGAGAPVYRTPFRGLVNSATAATRFRAAVVKFQMPLGTFALSRDWQLVWVDQAGEQPVHVTESRNDFRLGIRLAQLGRALLAFRASSGCWVSYMPVVIEAVCGSTVTAPALALVAKWSGLYFETLSQGFPVPGATVTVAAGTPGQAEYEFRAVSAVNPLLSVQVNKRQLRIATTATGRQGGTALSLSYTLTDGCTTSPVSTITVTPRCQTIQPAVRTLVRRTTGTTSNYVSVSVPPLRLDYQLANVYESLYLDPSGTTTSDSPPWFVAASVTYVVSAVPADTSTMTVPPGVSRTAPYQLSQNGYSAEFTPLLPGDYTIRASFTDECNPTAVTRDVIVQVRCSGSATSNAACLPEARCPQLPELSARVLSAGRVGRGAFTDGSTLLAGSAELQWLGNRWEMGAIDLSQSVLRLSNMTAVPLTAVSTSLPTVTFISWQGFYATASSAQEAAGPGPAPPARLTNSLTRSGTQILWTPPQGIRAGDHDVLIKWVTYSRQGAICAEAEIRARFTLVCAVSSGCACGTARRSIALTSTSVAATQLGSPDASTATFTMQVNPFTSTSFTARNSCPGSICAGFWNTFVLDATGVAFGSFANSATGIVVDAAPGNLPAPRFVLWTAPAGSALYNRSVVGSGILAAEVTALLAAQTRTQIQFTPDAPGVYEFDVYQPATPIGAGCGESYTTLRIAVPSGAGDKRFVPARNSDLCRTQYQTLLGLPIDPQYRLRRDGLKSVVTAVWNNRTAYMPIPVSINVLAQDSQTRQPYDVRAQGSPRLFVSGTATTAAGQVSLLPTISSTSLVNRSNALQTFASDDWTSTDARFAFPLGFLSNQKTAFQRHPQVLPSLVSNALLLDRAHVLLVEPPIAAAGSSSIDVAIGLYDATGCEAPHATVTVQFLCTAPLLVPRWMQPHPLSIAYPDGCRSQECDYLFALEPSLSVGSAPLAAFPASTPTQPRSDTIEVAFDTATGRFQRILLDLSVSGMLRVYRSGSSIPEESGSDAVISARNAVERRLIAVSAGPPGTSTADPGYELRTATDRRCVSDNVEGGVVPPENALTTLAATACPIWSGTGWVTAPPATPSAQCSRFFSNAQLSDIVPVDGHGTRGQGLLEFYVKRAGDFVLDISLVLKAPLASCVAFRRLTIRARPGPLGQTVGTVPGPTPCLGSSQDVSVASNECASQSDARAQSGLPCACDTVSAALFTSTRRVRWMGDRWESFAVSWNATATDGCSGAPLACRVYPFMSSERTAAWQASTATPRLRESTFPSLTFDGPTAQSSTATVTSGSVVAESQGVMTITFVGLLRGVDQSQRCPVAMATSSVSLACPRLVARPRIWFQTAAPVRRDPLESPADIRQLTWAPTRPLRQGQKYSDRPAPYASLPDSANVSVTIPFAGWWGVPVVLDVAASVALDEESGLERFTTLARLATETNAANEARWPPAGATPQQIQSVTWEVLEEPQNPLPAALRRILPEATAELTLQQKAWAVAGDSSAVGPAPPHFDDPRALSGTVSREKLFWEKSSQPPTTAQPFVDADFRTSAWTAASTATLGGTAANSVRERMQGLRPGQVAYDYATLPLWLPFPGRYVFRVTIRDGCTEHARVFVVTAECNAHPGPRPADPFLSVRRRGDMTWPDPLQALVLTTPFQPFSDSFSKVSLEARLFTAAAASLRSEVNATCTDAALSKVTSSDSTNKVLWQVYFPGPEAAGPRVPHTLTPPTSNFALAPENVDKVWAREIVAFSDPPQASAIPRYLPISRRLAGARRGEPAMNVVPVTFVAVTSCRMAFSRSIALAIKCAPLPVSVESSTVGVWSPAAPGKAPDTFAEAALAMPLACRQQQQLTDAACSVRWELLTAPPASRAAQLLTRPPGCALTQEQAGRKARTAPSALACNNQREFQELPTGESLTLKASCTSGDGASALRLLDGLEHVYYSCAECPPSGWSGSCTLTNFGAPMHRVRLRADAPGIYTFNATVSDGCSSNWTTVSMLVMSRAVLPPADQRSFSTSQGVTVPTMLVGQNAQEWSSAAATPFDTSAADWQSFTAVYSRRVGSSAGFARVLLPGVSTLAATLRATANARAGSLDDIAPGFSSRDTVASNDVGPLAVEWRIVSAPRGSRWAIDHVIATLDPLLEHPARFAHSLLEFDARGGQSAARLSPYLRERVHNMSWSVTARRASVAGRTLLRHSHHVSLEFEPDVEGDYEIDAVATFFVPRAASQLPVATQGALSTTALTSLTTESGTTFVSRHTVRVRCEGMPAIPPLLASDSAHAVLSTSVTGTNFVYSPLLRSDGTANQRPLVNFTEAGNMKAKWTVTHAPFGVPVSSVAISNGHTALSASFLPRESGAYRFQLKLWDPLCGNETSGVHIVVLVRVDCALAVTSAWIEPSFIRRVGFPATYTRSESSPAWYQNSSLVARVGARYSVSSGQVDSIPVRYAWGALSASALARRARLGDVAAMQAGTLFSLTPQSQPLLTPGAIAAIVISGCLFIALVVAVVINRRKLHAAYVAWMPTHKAAESSTKPSQGKAPVLSSRALDTGTEPVASSPVVMANPMHSRSQRSQRRHSVTEGLTQMLPRITATPPTPAAKTATPPAHPVGRPSVLQRVLTSVAEAVPWTSKRPTVSTAKLASKIERSQRAVPSSGKAASSKLANGAANVGSYMNVYPSPGKKRATNSERPAADGKASSDGMDALPAASRGKTDAPRSKSRASQDEEDFHFRGIAKISNTARPRDFQRRPSVNLVRPSRQPVPSAAIIDSTPALADVQIEQEILSVEYEGHAYVTEEITMPSDGPQDQVDAAPVSEAPVDHAQEPLPDESSTFYTEVQTSMFDDAPVNDWAAQYAEQLHSEDVTESVPPLEAEVQLEEMPDDAAAASASAPGTLTDILTSEPLQLKRGMSMRRF